jgi:hypothetical protein
MKFEITLAVLVAVGAFVCLLIAVGGFVWLLILTKGMA